MSKIEQHEPTNDDLEGHRYSDDADQPEGDPSEGDAATEGSRFKTYLDKPGEPAGDDTEGHGRGRS